MLLKTFTSQMMTALTTAIGTGVQAYNRLGNPATQEEPGIAVLFARLRGKLGCILLDEAEGCYLINTLSNAESLAIAEDWELAQWQVGQIILRLNRLRKEWEEGFKAIRKRAVKK